MATISQQLTELVNQKNALAENLVTKGVTASSSETLNTLVPKVLDIQTGGGTVTQFKIRTAELPNITIGLYNSNDSLVESKTTGASGGLVEFDLTENGTYTIKATNSESTQVWTNMVTISEIGVYNVKTGKALDDYTWAEIKTASEGGYAKYMWSLGDTKDLSAFMGQISTAYTRATIIGFDHDDLASGNGKAGITFKLPYTSGTYHHKQGTGNKMSWLGSLIRSNCLKSNEDQYIYTSVTNSTEGTYYTLNEDNETFTQVTLPTDYIEGTTYYSKTTLEADGAFIAGLPTDLSPVIKQVTKLTWGGGGGSEPYSDSIIIKTKDWLFCLSDGEIFGNENRYMIYTKYYLEGDQYNYYKIYEEDKFGTGSIWWLRSPLYTSGGFAVVSSSGTSSNASANAYHRVALCFCI